MNIDVREYLRINPISVHELSLSSNGNDCFLFFPMENKPRGYIAVTQWQMFNEFYKTIFGKLVKFDGQGHPRLDPKGVKPEDMDRQFTQYARRRAVEAFMQEFENELVGIDKDLDRDILILKRKGVLNYSGATEIQSIGEDAIPSLVKYEDFEKAIGQIWCQTFGIQPPDPAEEQSEVAQMLRHSHKATCAETFTRPISRNKLGGEALGAFTTGNYELVSQDDGRGASLGKTVNPIESEEETPLTYPLFGQNTLDWRTPERTHNNVPPCMNVHVKYMRLVDSWPRWTASQLMSFSDMAMRSSPKPQIEISELSAKQNSHVEAQYKSQMVKDLEEYLDENLSESDCLLRLQIQQDAVDDIKMTRQGVRQLLDIFVDSANKELASEDQTMWQVLEPFLFRILMTRQEFNAWYYRMVEFIQSIQGKIELVRQLMLSVKPLTYVGRVVMSTTDDTEQKVIAHYGGRRWMRIENFLRGVDDESELRKRMGEEYVCLRKSNVPIHTHNETLKLKITTQEQDWLQSGTTGEQTRLLNVQEPPIGAMNKYTLSNDVQNVVSNYQMSPLEYQDRKTMTLPHDNMPPHIKVYIWECREITDEEQELLTASPNLH